MRQRGIPLTRDNYRFFNWLGAPPEIISAEEEAEIDDAFRKAGVSLDDYDPDEPRNSLGEWTKGGASAGGSGSPGRPERAGGPGGGGGGAAGLREAQGSPAAALPTSGQVTLAKAAAAAAAGSYAPLEGLPQKPIVIGDKVYVLGPLAKARDAAADYMREAGLPYNPPTTYAKLDKERAGRIADEFERMKHDPDNPAVKASYEALKRETMAQWQAVKKTGLQVDWMQPGQSDPYAGNPRLAAMDVRDNNHWTGFPTDFGFGSGGEAGEAAMRDNPLLEQSGEVVGGHPARYNDLFRIVHDYFGHFKEGVGFRAEGEENAWRSHASMYSDAALPAMTSETRGQNSWVNFGPYGEGNRTASAADTHYAPQKIGIMPEWTMREGAR